MKLKIVSLSLLLVLLWFNARSQVTYSYNSPTFGSDTIPAEPGYVNPGSGLSYSDFISASVTYAQPLAPNLTDFTSNPSLRPDLPTDWLFSDGPEQWTPANSDFYVAQANTDASGNITGWDFTLYSQPGLSDPEVTLVASTPSNYALAEVNMAFSAPYATAYTIYNSQGTTWTTTPVPEPNGLSIFALSSLVTALIRRGRRMTRNKKV